jgi:O-acetyl-ADP-ribose deacetylase (regulator of RNase III)
MSSTTDHLPSAAESQKSHLPTIHLLCRFETSSKAFQDAVEKYFPKLHEATNVTIHNCSLARFPSEVQYDAIVSPANSYGFMDGAFDDAISIALSPNPKEGYGWTTKKVQTTLYQKWRGYAPPGSCTLIDVRRDSTWHEIKRAEQSSKHTGEASEENKEHKSKCKYIALCPTMRVPREVKWDREVIFECIWSLLCTLESHNREVNDPGLQIKSILMTPLATGIGRVSEAKWAAQCVMGMKYWLEAVENPDKWSNLQWEDVYDDSSEMLDSTDNL